CWGAGIHRRFIRDFLDRTEMRVIPARRQHRGHDMRTGILHRNWAVISVAVLTVAISSAVANACPPGTNGCTQGNAVNNRLICSKQCLTDGYTISVVQAVAGGFLPSSCGNPVPGAWYEIVDGTTEQQNYSQVEMTSLPQGVLHNILKQTLENPTSNTLYCDTSGNYLTPPFWTLTIANTQANMACVMIGDPNMVNCNSSATAMAHKFNTLNAGIQLPDCRDNKCTHIGNGTSVGPGAPDCHGGTGFNGTSCVPIGSVVITTIGDTRDPDGGQLHGRYPNPARKVVPGRPEIVPGTSVGNGTEQVPGTNAAARDKKSRYPSEPVPVDHGTNKSQPVGTAIGTAPAAAGKSKSDKKCVSSDSAGRAVSVECAAGQDKTAPESGEHR
ncbi:MAG TPA: hypothetical protein VK753_02415, partial [Xanthomonadaceae bacterium]|nr:hypothetical protein [Xanthomonadaceae bacterium]